MKTLLVLSLCLALDFGAIAAPSVTVIHGALLTAVQPHAEADLVTETTPLPAAALVEILVGSRVDEHTMPN